jgi:hypothetical protein
MPLPIATPIPPDRLVALALARATSPDAVGLVHLYAVAVATCWEGPLPWHANNAREAARLEAENRSLEAWIKGAPATSDRTNLAELDRGRQDIAANKARIRSLTAARFHLSLNPVDLEREGLRALMAFQAENIPLLAIVQEGQRILAEAERVLTAGYAEFSDMDAAGFFPAPTGPVSAGASNSLPTTGGMLSSGSK